VGQHCSATRGVVFEDVIGPKKMYY